MAFGDDTSFKKKAAEDADLDITPMIDVTFLLLIFFMVASTMQPSEDVKLAPARHGKGANPEAMIELAVMAPASPGATPVVMLESKEVTLAEVTAYVRQNAEAFGHQVMIKADRDVTNGFLSELYSAIREVEGMQFQCAVEDSSK